MDDAPRGRDQQQFLNVIDRDEAERRFHAALRLAPRGEECVALHVALGRILSRPVVAAVDVPSFDRSNVDGFALRAEDTFGATEERPRRLALARSPIATGVIPSETISRGGAIGIATGGMIPRGADAVAMVEHTDCEGDELLVRKAVTPGQNISFAGSDIASGETVLQRGDRLTSRETGVLAAIGVDRVWVWRRARVAILSTGDELIAPGETIRLALVYDSNARILADAVRELGGEPFAPILLRDNLTAIRAALDDAMREADLVLLSGGTSKGEGDLCYRAVAELARPGIVAHGVALKPGKPICLAASDGKPVVVLPGFPTSAIFTFHEFVAPVLRRLCGDGELRSQTTPARLAVRVNSEVGRTEYLLVSLLPVASPTAGDSLNSNVEGAACAREDHLPTAMPMGKGSGSVTTFSRADGFITIGRHEEIVSAGEIVDVRLLGRDLPLADLVVVGSHCVGLDRILGYLQAQGWRCKAIAVGSTAGLEAVRNGQCDLAGIHLLDPVTGVYNRPFLPSGVELLPGYRRRQGIVFRQGDRRFSGRAAREAIAAAIADETCVMVNRNQASGTRILVDQLLAGARPPGYANQPRSHNAVAAAVAQHRADWGVAIETVASAAGLAFLEVADEQFDFAVCAARADRPAVRAFGEALADATVRRELTALGFSFGE